MVASICRQHRAQPLGGDVLDVGLAGLDRRDLALVDVDRDDVLARLRERDDERQTHVSETDDADRHDGSRRYRASLMRAAPHG